MPGKIRIPVTFWRKVVQAAFLFVFLYLFRKTDYAGSDEIPYAVNIFFRWDPLVAASAMLAAKAVLAVLLPALAVVLLTIIFGRFFCGWLCPLGTLLDLTHYVIPPRLPGRVAGHYRSIKYFLLGVILSSAFFGLPLVGYFDPFSILVRGLTLAVDPAFNVAATFPFDWLYRYAPGWVTAVSEPIFAFLKTHVLPFRQTFFTLTLVSLGILFAVFALEWLQRRFWCRNICPLGALLGLLARLTPLRWHPGIACHKDGCHTCSEVCRMGAIDPASGRISPEACTLCLDCVEACPRGIVTFKFKNPTPRPTGLDISRRVFLGTLATGILLPAFFKTRAALKVSDPRLIRPPGALAEEDFIQRCVRCGECMKVCIGNALQPTLFEAGPEGMFSPRLIPRIGYCEYNCTLCGQVCPTEAIRKLTLDQKHETRIGRAWFDKNRCLPYARGIPCLVCEEHCPVPDKAIKLREATVLDQDGAEVTLQQPYVVDALCIGCGICENKCPLPGDAAVHVTREGESRDPDAGVLIGTSYYQTH